jgi:hypothetical protein
MSLGREGAHIELGRDLVVCKALGHEAQDLALTLGERLQDVGG